MSKKKTQSSAKQTALTPWQIGVVAGVIILIAGVLWLKGRPAASEATEATPPSTNGIAAPVATEAVAQADLAPLPGESAEAHLNRMIEAGQPALAFFHSHTCHQCAEMIRVLDEVYPDFSGQVALVDVDVYDDANRALLQRAGIWVIPTLIFIERGGGGHGYTGVMMAEQVREELLELVAGGTP